MVLKLVEDWELVLSQVQSDDLQKLVSDASLIIDWIVFFKQLDQFWDDEWLLRNWNLMEQVDFVVLLGYTLQDVLVSLFFLFELWLDTKTIKSDHKLVAVELTRLINSKLIEPCAQIFISLYDGTTMDVNEHLLPVMIG